MDSSSSQEDTSVFCDVVGEASQPSISLQVDTIVWRCVDFNSGDVSTDMVVQALLEQTMGEEERERRCESCSSEKARVGGKIVTQPRLLILNLKRYSAEGSVDY